MIENALLIVAASFVGVLAIFLGIYWYFVLRPEGAAERTIKQRLKVTGAARRERASLQNAIKPLSSVPAVEKLLAKSTSLVQPLERFVERSGLKITVGQLLLGSLLLASVSAWLVVQLSGQVLFAPLAAGLVGVIPYALVRYAASRRLAKFEEQFPEAIDLIARALRAGHAFTTGLGMVADEVADPVRSEFALLHDRQNYGMPLPDALRIFAERVPLLDARFFATAVLTQREAGGNLAEVLDNLAAIIRDRFKLKRQVRVLSAHGRITGWILGILPFVIGGALFMIAPDHIMVLFRDPIGHGIIAISMVLQVIGVITIRKIVNIEV